MPPANLFVADTGNYTIRKITPGRRRYHSRGVGVGQGHHPDGQRKAAALFWAPFGIAVDGNDGLVCHRWQRHIRKVAADGPP